MFRYNHNMSPLSPIMILIVVVISYGFGFLLFGHFGGTVLALVGSYTYYYTVQSVESNGE